MLILQATINILVLSFLKYILKKFLEMRFFYFFYVLCKIVEEKNGLVSKEDKIYVFHNCLELK